MPTTVVNIEFTLFLTKNAYAALTNIPYPSVKLLYFALHVMENISEKHQKFITFSFLLCMNIRLLRIFLTFMAVVLVSRKKCKMP